MKTSQTKLPQPNQIITGDCLQLMATWPKESMDLIFADPPYNIGFTYDQYKDKLEDEKYVAWTQDWIHQCARLLKPSGSMYILIGDEYVAEARVILKKLEKQGQLFFRNWIVWHYTFGQNCQIKFNRSHAHILYLVGSAVYPPPTAKNKKRKPNFTTKNIPFTFNKQTIAVPSARQLIYKDKRATHSGKLPDDTWYLRPQESTEEFFKKNADTWYQSRLCGSFSERQHWHPCQLPQALLERIIKLSSNPDDLVFDPFAGSGTTLTVAKQLNRKFLACELSQQYAQKATLRIQQTTPLPLAPTPPSHIIVRGSKDSAAQRAKNAPPSEKPPLLF